MAIKLKTEPNSSHAAVCIWFNAGEDNLYHDAAVAHALVRAIGEYINGDTVLQRAAQILRSDFGIED